MTQHPVRRWLTNPAEVAHPTIQAALAIVCDSTRGDLPDKLVAVIETDPATDRAWIDWAAAVEVAQRFPNRERRLVTLAASLASEHPVDLADVLTGHDYHTTQLVTHALTHATKGDTP